MAASDQLEEPTPTLPVSSSAQFKLGLAEEQLGRTSE